jgi:hypothetical protein
MNCEGLLKRLGFHCRLVAENTIAVGTPFHFCDGEPIGFYLDERGNEVRLSDNSDTLFHMSSIGMDISDRRAWRGVRQIVSSFGFELLETGEIVGNGLLERQQQLITKYIGAMLAVADLEREHLGLSEEMETYIKEVEMYLKAWKPNASFSYYPAAQGHSGRLHTFHFEFDAKLVDAAKPHSGRTGSILRKAADVINSGDKRSIMVVMDDREDVERANVETDILSTMVSVMSFTRLAGQSSGNLKPS